MSMKTHLTTIHLLLVATLATAQPSTMPSLTLTQNTRLAGRGNAHEVILKARISSERVLSLQSATISLGGTTDLSDINKIRIYNTYATNDFDSRNAAGATLVGEHSPTKPDFDITLSGELPAGNTYLWLTASLSDSATEGHHLDAALLSLTTTQGTLTATDPDPEGYREIVLRATTLYRGGDHKSQQYRIPTLITAHDGSLVALTDKRKNNIGDLPQDIDIICKRSTNGGATWSEPLTLAQGTGYKHGFGDAAITWGQNENELVALFVGGNGLFDSSPDDRIKTYMTRSTDNGISWSTPRDISEVIYDKGFTASFCASGNGLLCTTGRIMFVAAIRETTGYDIVNYLLYSDDNGNTWQLSKPAFTNGNEAKVVELTDGRILMSIRQDGRRAYCLSDDGGTTWSEPSTWEEMDNDRGTNGDIIRYTSTTQGHDKNRILHSFPKHSNARRNVSVFLSYDEGKTWPISRCITPYKAAYSSLCILHDGSIGLYVEENHDDKTVYHEPWNTWEDEYEMVFYNFSLEWLTCGNDTIKSSETR